MLPFKFKKTGKNSYDKMEFAGAFGDLGTFVPFVFALILLTDVDAKGIFFSFGIALIFAGYYFRTPMPVQPMKLISGIAIASPATITVGMISGAGFFIALFWFFLAGTNLIKYIVKWITAPIATGISLALGVSFVIKSFDLMSDSWMLAAIAVLVAIVFYRSRAFPMMFALLLLAVVVIIIQTPGIAGQVLAREIAFTPPGLNLRPFTWTEMVAGIIVLAIPQLPLSLGNAVVAVTRENNTRFPDRPTSEREVTFTQGIINIISPFFGGIAMCHGAGGLVGHNRFGARTGGSVIIIGLIFLLLATLFSQFIEFIMLFPFAIIGVILLFTGLDLLMSIKGLEGREDKIFALITGLLAIWNMLAAILIVIALQFIYGKYKSCQQE